MNDPKNEISAPLERSSLRWAAPGGPLWQKAPWLLFRYPELLIATVSAAFILALAAASAPLFLSSAGTAALAQQTSAPSSSLAGLNVLQYQAIPDQTLKESTERRDEVLRARLDGVSGFKPRILTLFGPQVELLNETETGPRGQLITRTDAIDHVEVLEDGPGVGVWIADLTAEESGLQAGDFVTLFFNGETVGTRVAGVYEALVRSPPSDYWQPLRRSIYTDPGGDAIPPPFVIASEDLFYELDQSLADERPLARWEWPIEKSGLSLERATALSSLIREIEHDLDQAALGDFAVFQFPNHFTVLGDLVTGARETIDGISSPVRLLSIAGIFVALVMIASSGVYGIRRRRVEAALLSARGVGSVAFALKAGIEALIPVCVGAALGWLLAPPLIRWLGPSSILEPGAKSAALDRVVLVGVIALVLVAVVSAAAGRREAEAIGSPLPGAIKHAPWEAVLLVLAAAAYFAIGEGGIAPTEQGDDPARVDVFLLLFPILLIAGGAALATRGLQHVLPRLKGAGASMPATVFLAARRLAAASRLALALVSASALAIGILCYAGTLVESTRATAEAKAQISTGSDLSGTLQTGARVPSDLPFPATVVERVDQMTLAPSERLVVMMIVEPDTFARTAFWDEGFGDGSLSELLSKLQSDGDRLPVISVGPGATGDALELFSTTIPIEVVATSEVWPGMIANQPTLVAARPSLERILEEGGGSLGGAIGSRELWAKGQPDVILRTLAREDVAIGFVQTAASAKSTPALLAASWTLSFLQAIGIAAGLVVLAGLLFYLQARQRAGIVSFALARRMGLRASTYRWSVVMELAGMLMIALLIGIALAVAAVLLVYRRFDVLPQLPPDPLLRLPILLFAGTAAILLISSVIGGWRTQRVAQRANVAEVLRLVG